MKKLLFLFLLIPCFVLAQQQEGSNKANRIKLENALRLIGKKNQITFYYKTDDISDKYVNPEIISQSPNECYKLLFEEYLLHTYHLSPTQVAIYRGRKIRESLTLESQPTPIGPDHIEKDDAEVTQQQSQYKIFNIGTPGKKTRTQQYFRGKVTELSNGDPVVGANVVIAGTTRGSSSDKDGNFQLPLTSGNYTINYSSIGMEPTQRNINFYSTGNLNVSLKTKINVIGDIEIHGNRQGNVDRTTMGVELLDVKEIKSLPTLLGEPDVIKSALYLPGVQSAGEGTQGFNVRGGKTDQNLILIDQAPVYAPSHLFGNFSAINSDAIEGATLYKGSVPASQGGRLSSVYDIKTRDGDYKKLHGGGGISPLSLRFMLEGPIVKNKLSFLTSARSTYSDWLLNQVKTPKLYKCAANFYDVQQKFTYKINKKQRLTLNAYFSNDEFKLRSDTLYQYSNIWAVLNWKNNVSQALQVNSSIVFSKYVQNTGINENPIDDFNLNHEVQNTGFKTDFVYNYNSHKFGFGLSSTFNQIQPGNRTIGSESKIIPFQSYEKRSVESAIYLSDEFNIGARLTAETGIRLSNFIALKSEKMYAYQADAPIAADNIVDTIYHQENNIDKVFLNPEFRFSMKYAIRANSSLKFSYNKSTQYLHLLTNSNAISPTDTWTPSSKHIKPQIGHQLSLGYFWELGDGKLELSAEIYRKWLKNLKEFKPGANLLLNDHIETELLNGTGRAYGFELSLKRNTGRIYGVLNYAYSRSEIKTESEFQEDIINNGEYFPSSYDRPHNLNLLTNVKLSRRLTFSLNTVYLTGRPITIPVSRYRIGNRVILHYTNYNQFRIPDYFRTDVSLTINGNLKRKKLAHSSIALSVYNLTGRKNAYSVYFRGNNTKVNGYKLSIFGVAIPTVTYNFKF